MSDEIISREKYNSLSLWQKLVLFIWGVVYIGEESRPGWKGKLSFFIFYCPACGKLCSSHPHGYSGRLVCSFCHGV